MITSPGWWERKRCLFFDEGKVPGEVADVLEAAALLEVTEFELFRIACRRWFGADIDDGELERFIYLPYMFRGQVPPWMRQLVRTVIAEIEALDLEPTACRRVRSRRTCTIAACASSCG
jgi:hypothetical protein